MIRIVVLIMLIISYGNEKESSPPNLLEPRIIHKLENQKLGNIDLGRSVILWKGTKLTGKHEGTVQFRSGNLVLKDDQLVSGHLTVDLMTIEITDIPKHEKEALSNLLRHLHEEFDITSHQLATFQISKVKYLSSEKLVIYGILTIKDISKPAEVTAYQVGDKFTAHFTFDGFDWGIGENGSWFAKRLVDPEIQLSITINIM